MIGRWTCPARRHGEYGFTKTDLVAPGHAERLSMRGFHLLLVIAFILPASGAGAADAPTCAGAGVADACAEVVNESWNGDTDCENDDAWSTQRIEVSLVVRGVGFVRIFDTHECRSGYSGYGTQPFKEYRDETGAQVLVQGDKGEEDWDTSARWEKIRFAFGQQTAYEHCAIRADHLGPMGGTHTWLNCYEGRGPATRDAYALLP